MSQIQPPADHTCWQKRPASFAEYETPDIATERTCPACQWLAGYSAALFSGPSGARFWHHKVCPQCGIDKLRQDYYPLRTAGTHRTTTKCKECVKAERRTRYHRQLLLAKARSLSLSNPSIDAPGR